jgi:hypothetical protein
MRKVSVKRWPIGDEPKTKRISIYELLRELSEIAYGLHDGHVPSMQTVNSILETGHGEETLAGLTWTPFRITDKEYTELAARFKTSVGLAQHT